MYSPEQFEEQESGVEEKIQDPFGDVPDTVIAEEINKNPHLLEPHLDQEG